MFGMDIETLTEFLETVSFLEMELKIGWLGQHEFEEELQCAWDKARKTSTLNLGINL